jgi:hypothetical protein
METIEAAALNQMIHRTSGLVTVLEYGATLSRVLDERGNDFTVKTKDLKHPKPTKKQKYDNQVSKIRAAAISYYVAGWLLTHPTRYNASAPEGDQTEAAIDKLLEVGMASAAVTHGKNLAQGKSFSLVTVDFGDSVADTLAIETSVNAPHRNPLERSIQAVQFVLDFLGGDLGFQLAKEQDVPTIVSRIPAQFVAAFEQGRRGDLFTKS